MFLCICVPWLDFQALLCCQNSFSSFSQASRPFRCLTFTFALYQRKRNKGLDLSTPITISLERAAEKWPSSQQSYQPLFNHCGKERENPFSRLSASQWAKLSILGGRNDTALVWMNSTFHLSHLSLRSLSLHNCFLCAHLNGITQTWPFIDVAFMAASRPWGISTSKRYVQIKQRVEEKC